VDAIERHARAIFAHSPVPIEKLTDAQKERVILHSADVLDSEAARDEADDEQNIALATAISMSEFTAHMPRIHTFLTSQSAWIDPVTSFIAFFAASRRDGVFEAFGRLVQRQLEEHLVDNVLSMDVFARFCLVASNGGFLDDLAWLDEQVIGQIHLLMLVESERSFASLIDVYASLPIGRDEADRRREEEQWEGLFGDPVEGTAAPLGVEGAASVVGGLVHAPVVFDKPVAFACSTGVDAVSEEPREVRFRRRNDELMPVATKPLAEALRQAREALHKLHSDSR
jgi:hypothetical protein